MATVPKVVPVATQPHVSANRLGPSTRVASSGHPVDELQNSVGTSLDSDAFRFHEEDNSLFDHGGNRHARQHQTGIFMAPTQTFAAMFESGGSGRGDDESASNVKTTRFAGLVSKAIAIYENNARIIAGEGNVLGTSVSLVL